MVLDSPWINTQYYNVGIKGKWSYSGKEFRPPVHLGVIAIKVISIAENQ